MKFAVGYQLHEGEDESFVDIVMFYHEHIGEVYFPWLDTPSGRSSLSNRRGTVNWKAQEQLENDLLTLRKAGIKLDLLLNANCYGRNSMSQYLANNICSIIDHIGSVVGELDIVTTASPAIAHIVKSNFPDIEVRASVNMRIGTVKGMQYLAHLFDSYCMQRDYNRSPGHIEELLEWAKTNDKKLVMLANSGCLSFCSGQIFHDNLVAHESEIGETYNITGWIPYTCWNYYKDPDNWVSVLQNTWIRPEDLHNYEKYFPVVKLATRMHSRPGMVIDAYVRGRYYGNLLDLFEPGFGPAFAPYVIDNSRFPDDWFEVTTKCNKKCHECNYCKDVLKAVLIRME
ncbi:MAG TPA: hypothetical protein GXX37_11570 [Clostridiaceae bacterium]|nr:hypothetical protein [Clostridiaceae bacterium]